MRYVVWVIFCFSADGVSDCLYSHIGECGERISLFFASPIMFINQFNLTSEEVAESRSIAARKFAEFPDFWINDSKDLRRPFIRFVEEQKNKLIDVVTSETYKSSFENSLIRDVLGRAKSYMQSLNSSTGNIQHPLYSVKLWTEVYRPYDTLPITTEGYSEGAVLSGLYVSITRGETFKIIFSDTRGANPPFGQDKEVHLKEGEGLLWPGWQAILVPPPGGVGAVIWRYEIGFFGFPRETRAMMIDPDLDPVTVGFDGNNELLSINQKE